MGSKNNSPPPAPDPAATSAAQSAANRETAITQSQLNMVNQNTPSGSLSYTQTGTWADGTPRFEANTTLSPEQQALFDKQNQIYGTALDTGNTLFGNVQQKAGEAPPEYNDAYRQEQLARIQQRNQPQMERDRAALETQLANQGITLGSEAYNTAISQFGQRQNDFNLAADTQAGNEARQAYATALAGRNQPINELSALLGLGQVQTPQFQNTPQTGVAPTDVIGPMNTAYQGQLAGWQNGQANNRALLGAATQLGGAALGGWAYGGFR